MIFVFMKKFLLPFLVVFLLLGCVQQPDAGNGNGNNNGGVEVQVIEAGDSVKVDYRGELENGEVFDASERHGSPLEFVAGAGQMIKGFDKAVVGMRVGQEKTVTLAPEDAYGLSDESKVVEVSKENFGDAWDALEVGTPVHSSQGVNGVVKEKKESSAIVDFNHDLAGKTLVFWIKVVEIEKGA